LRATSRLTLHIKDVTQRKNQNTDKSESGE